MKRRIVKKLAKWYLRNPHLLKEDEVRKISNDTSVTKYGIITGKIISINKGDIIESC